MATTVSAPANEIEVLRQQNRMTHQVVRRNTDGISHAESLLAPHPAGNCMNWVVGHLLCVYNNVLPGIGQTAVMEKAELARYDRGSAPLQPAGEAMDFGALLVAFDKAVDRFDAGLSNLTTAVLDQKAPFSPTNNPDETMRSLITTVLFHQSYHAGQTGILRRVAGKPGAIR